MKIECPICSMQIDITKAHVGRKGRCSRCESKFIIPANPDDDFAKEVRVRLTSEPGRYAAYTREYLGWGVFALMVRW